MLLNPWGYAHYSVKQIGQYRIFCYIPGYIVFCIICTHLLLINILLKYCPQNSGTQRIWVLVSLPTQLPLVGIKEGKNASKCLISNSKIWICMFYSTGLKQTAMHIRNATEKVSK